MEEAFLTGSRYEYLLWDAAYRWEKWPFRGLGWPSGIGGGAADGHRLGPGSDRHLGQ